MAKPRVFVSSTYYDLKHIRNSLEAFIDSFGYEAVLFESGDIPFHHDLPLDESCYNEIHSCHLLVLIIGGRYGSPSSEIIPKEEVDLEEQYHRFNSITKKEYETAREKDIPIFIFVEKSVLAEYQTFKENRNRTDINYAHVDSKNVFKLLDEILIQKRNNYLKDFEKFDDISTWLRDQWAGLFADFLSRKSSEATVKDLSSQINDLKQTSIVLREYTESIFRKLQPEESIQIISSQERRLKKISLSKFKRAPLIEHILSYKNHIKAPFTLTRLFNAFEKYNTLEEIFISLKASEEFPLGFCEDKQVINDFEQIKAEIFGHFVNDEDA